jgi:hypothetical protein
VSSLDELYAISLEPRRKQPRFCLQLDLDGVDPGEPAVGQVHNVIKG